MNAPPAALEDPVAVITGASRGIGLAVAKRFVTDGYRVLIIGRVIAARSHRRARAP